MSDVSSVKPLYEVRCYYEDEGNVRVTLFNNTSYYDKSEARKVYDMLIYGKVKVKLDLIKVVLFQCGIGGDKEITKCLIYKKPVFYSYYYEDEDDL